MDSFNRLMRSDAGFITYPRGFLDYMYLKNTEETFPMGLFLES